MASISSRLVAGPRRLSRHQPGVNASSYFLTGSCFGGVRRGRVVIDRALNAASDLGITELPDQPEGHVDPRGDAACGDRLSVAHVANAFEHGDRRALAELIEERPVRRRALSI